MRGTSIYYSNSRRQARDPLLILLTASIGKLLSKGRVDRRRRGKRGRMEGGVGLFTIGNMVTVNGRGEGRLLLLGQEVVWL